MAFGISFGSKKSSGSSKTRVSKTEAGSQAESGIKSSTGVTSGTSSTQESQSGSTTSQQSGTSAQQSTGSQQSSSTTSQFSESTLAALEAAAQGLLGGSGNPQFQSTFDVDQFVSSGVGAARNRLQTDLNTNLNAMYDEFGGRDDDNSMVALLENRARGDSEAALAQVYANLEAQGRGIARENFMVNQQGSQNYLQNVLSALKGGITTQQGQVQTAESTTGQQSQTGSGTSQSTGTSNTQSQQTQALVEQLSSLINSISSMSGTESSKTKGKESGGGFGLSL